MNILFIVPALTGGGAEKIIGYLSKAFQENNNNVYITTFFEAPPDYLFKGDLIPLKDLSKKKFFLTSKLNKLYYIYQLRKIKKIKKIDVSISFLELSDILNFFSQRGELAISSIRNNLPEKYKIMPKFTVFLHKFCLKRYRKIIAISHGIKEDLIHNYNIEAERLKVIYNFLDDLDYNSNEKKTNPTEEIILNIGRLTTQKGQWHLIKAFSILVKNRPNVKLVILGRGGLEKNLKALAKNLKVYDKIDFKGFTRYPFPVICQSNIFVLTSLYEGLSNSILEVGVCGKPIISTDCNFGPREILLESLSYVKNIKDHYIGKYGILIEPFQSSAPDFTSSITNQEQKLAKLMNDLLENKELQKDLSKNIKMKIQRDFNKKNIINQWLEEISK